MKSIKIFLLLGPLFSTLNAHGTGWHTRTIENEITGYGIPGMGARHFVCELENLGGRLTSWPIERDKVVGTSYGPLGQTTHYKKVPGVYTHKTPDYWQCKKCKCPWMFTNPSAPKITIISNKSNKTMVVNSWFASRPCISSSNKSNYGHFERVCAHAKIDIDSWVNTLKSLWKTASILDEIESDTPGLNPAGLWMEMDVWSRVRQRQDDDEDNSIFEVKKARVCSIQ